MNAFTVLLDAAPKLDKKAHQVFAERERIWLFSNFFEADNPDEAIGEIVIGEAADDYSNEEAEGWIAKFNGGLRSRA